MCRLTRTTAAITQHMPNNTTVPASMADEAPAGRLSPKKLSRTENRSARASENSSETAYAISPMAPSIKKVLNSAAE